MFAPRLVLAAALSAALATPLMSGTAAAESTLRVGLAEDPDILDPTLARSYVGRIVFASLCDKLFDIDENLKIVPQLALSYEVSSDGKEVLIKLRPNVVFHDGEKLDAAAAKYSLERHLNMKGSFRRGEISPIDKVEVVDPLAIKLVLKTPYSPLIAQLTDRSGMMVSPKAAEAMGDKFGTKPVCAGPYKFVERVAQQRIVVEKFDGYWNKDNVHIDKIVYQPIEDATVRLANLRSGNLDIIERMLATDLDSVKKDGKLKLASGLELGYVGLTMNLANGDRSKTPFLQNAKVRQAFDLAIDREAIVQVVFAGEFLAGNQWVSPKHAMYAQNMPMPKRDVAAAKKLLAESGVKLPVTVEMMVPNAADSRQVAEVIQSMVKEVGIDVKIRVTEFATALTAANKGDFEMFLIGWSGRVDPDGNLYGFVASKAPFNDAHYSDAEVDKLLAEQRSVNDPAARKKIFEQIAAKTLKEGPIYYIYHRRLFFPYLPRLQGFKAYPDGMIRVVGLKLAP